MIDIEQDVYTVVREAVLAVHPGATVASSTESSPAVFPFVSVQELNNRTRTDTIDSGSNERHVRVIYQIDCYSNAAAGKKRECKSLLAAADEAMIRAGFSRTMANPINMDRATIYRMTARYEASADAEHNIYRR